MDATLGLLLALPATGSLVLVLLDRLCGVPVADTLVALVQQLVVGHVVFLDVLLDLFERPVGQGVDLDETSLVDLDHIEIATLATLTAAASRENSMDVEFTIGTLGRFDLGDPVVELIVCLPELGSVLLGKLFRGFDTSWLVDMDVVQRVPLADTVNKSQGFWEVVESVEENQINHLWAGHLKLRKHVKGDKTGQPKRSGLEEMRKRRDAPSQDFYVLSATWPLEGPEEGHTVLTLGLKEL